MRSAFMRLLLAICITKFIKAQSGTLQSLTTISQLLEDLNSTDITTNKNGNINIIKNNNGNGESISLCYMPYLVMLSNNGKAVNNDEAHEGLAAVLLALEHLNTGNGTIVPQLAGLNEKCPNLQFYTDALDTLGQDAVSVKHVIRLTEESDLVSCAILSATDTQQAMMTSIFSGIRDVPQISSMATSFLLDNPEFELFGRTIPDDYGIAISLVAILKEWDVNHLAILHVNDAYGNSFTDAIRRVAGPQLNTISVNIDVDADEADITYAVQVLKQTKFTYIFCTLFNSVVDKVMIEAYDQGIAGNGIYTWIFSDIVDTSPLTSTSFPVGSPLAKAYQGCGLIEAVGGLANVDVPVDEAYNQLTLAMQQLKNEEDLAVINDRLDNSMSDANHSSITESEEFLSWPGFLAPFLYDAAVGLGIAACNLVSELSGKSDFTGEQLFQNLIHREFDGASRTVVFDNITGTRTHESALIALVNFVSEVDDNGMVRFNMVPTDMFNDDEWTDITPFIFGDGTTNIPNDLTPFEVNKNHLGPELIALGIIICGIAVCLSIGFAIWTYCNHKVQVIRASQPIFLYMIAVGCATMAVSIIPLTVASNATYEHPTDAACMAFPWCIACGFALVFSALATKTYRIAQVMKNAEKFKRIKLTASNVMCPMAVFLSLNIIVLSVWTAVSPLRSEIIVMWFDSFSRPVDTHPNCSSEGSKIFVSILTVMNLGSLAASVFQAYRARNISTELSESTYIFRALSIILYVSFLAIPVIILSQNNHASFYFAISGFIFIVCLVILLLIFGPKILAVRKKKKEPTSAPVNRQWGLTVNRAKPAEESKSDSEMSESNSPGIRILGTAGTSTLRKENEELKKLIREMSQSQGLDYKTLLKDHSIKNGGSSARIPDIKEDDSEEKEN